MITKKNEFYNIKCDCCGQLLDDENYWEEQEGIESMLVTCDWKATEDGKHYCPECYHHDDDDNLVIKDGRMYDDCGDLIKDKQRIMSKKQVTARAEYLKMNIELADNGIIIRNPNEEDEVTLALTREYDGEVSNENEYRAIGKKIYDWLMGDVTQKHKDDIIITNFDVDVQVKAKGREFA